MEPYVIAGIALVFAFCAVLVTIGEREPQVIFYAKGFFIKCMFGRRVAFSEIADVHLLDERMRDIGTGMRTGGYGGRALKGHFTRGLLFVRPAQSPTILIERHNAKDIYISFADSARTRELYEQLLQNLRKALTE